MEQKNVRNMSLKPIEVTLGAKVGNYTVYECVDCLESLWIQLQNRPVIFWKHKVVPTAFFSKLEYKKASL